MRLKSSRPLDGLQWMVNGMRTFRRQPLGFSSLMGLVMLWMGLLLVIPVAGPLLMLASLPGLSAGWVACGRAADQGERVSPRLLFSAFGRASRPAVLALGAGFAAVGWLVLTGMDLADPEFRSQWATAMRSSENDETRGTALVAAQQGLLLRAAAIVPVSLLFWHAPVLAHREGASAAKALFGSILAVKQHFTAFAVYGLTWLLADVIISMGLGAIMGLLGASDWAVALAMPMSLVFCAAFYASLHATVDGCMTLE